MSTKVKYVDENGVPRNFRDQPVLIGPDGNPKVYGRVSSFSSALKGGGSPGLTTWHQRLAVAGVCVRPDLQVRAGDLVDQHGFDPLDKSAKDEWAGLIGEALKAADSEYWSRTGTLIHAAIETAHSDPNAVLDVEPQHLDHVEAFFATVLPKYEILETEVFVVNEEFGLAGTLDLLLRDRETDQVLVGDTKTGMWDARYPIGVTVQVYVYSSSDRYDLKTGERSPLHPFLDYQTGILAHVPAKVSPAECKLYPLDLWRGRDLAQLCDAVRSNSYLPALKALA